MTRLSVIVPLRDERPRIDAFLAMIDAQTRQPDEVIIADGMSTDGSRDALAAAAWSRPYLKIVDNPRQHVPAALNCALAGASGDIVARMDTHALYDTDYLRQVSELLEQRPDVAAVGGAMDTRGNGSWGEAIAATLRRPFGLGGARHRIDGHGGPIEHVFSGCYRREVLLAVGGWDERFHANEDYEADQRIRNAGGTIWLLPSARSTWYVRGTLAGLSRQMVRYGYHRSLTVHEHPRSLRGRQLAPPAIAIVVASAAVSRSRPLVLLSGAYLTAAGALGMHAAHRDGASRWRGLVVPPTVHLSWGAGFLSGLVRWSFPSTRSRDEPGGTR